MKSRPLRSTSTAPGPDSSLPSAISNRSTPARSNSPESATTVSWPSCRVATAKSAIPLVCMSNPLLRGEKRDAGGEAVDEAARADRTDLAGTEEAGGGRGPDLARERVRVVAGAAEHVRAAPVAREHERPGGWAVELTRGPLERAAQVEVGRCRIAHVEPHRLADPDALADRDGALLLVDRHQRTDEEVAALVVRAVLVDHDAHEQPLGGERLLIGRQLVANRMHQAIERWFARQLLDDVAVARRHDHLGADRRCARGAGAVDSHVPQPSPDSPDRAARAVVEESRGRRLGRR